MSGRTERNRGYSCLHQEVPVVRINMYIVTRKRNKLARLVRVREREREAAGGRRKEGRKRLCRCVVVVSCSMEGSFEHWKVRTDKRSFVLRHVAGNSHDVVYSYQIHIASRSYQQIRMQSYLFLSPSVVYELRYVRESSISLSLVRVSYRFP